jgi:hypothetical protein
MLLSPVGARCQLGRQPWAYTFADVQLSAFAAALFAAIVQGWAAASKQLQAPPPLLNRCDGTSKLQLLKHHTYVVNVMLMAW